MLAYNYQSMQPCHTCTEKHVSGLSTHVLTMLEHTLYTLYPSMYPTMHAASDATPRLRRQADGFLDALGGHGQEGGARWRLLFTAGARMPCSAAPSRCAWRGAEALHETTGEAESAVRQLCL